MSRVERNTSKLLPAKATRSGYGFLRESSKWSLHKRARSRDSALNAADGGFCCVYLLCHRAVVSQSCHLSQLSFISELLIKHNSSRVCCMHVNYAIKCLFIKKTVLTQQLNLFLRTVKQRKLLHMHKYTTSTQISWYDIINHRHGCNGCRHRELTLSVRLSFHCKHRVHSLCVVNAWLMICQGVRTRFLVYYDE